MRTHLLLHAGRVALQALQLERRGLPHPPEPGRRAFDALLSPDLDGDLQGTRARGVWRRSRVSARTTRLTTDDVGREGGGNFGEETKSNPPVQKKRRKRNRGAVGWSAQVGRGKVGAPSASSRPEVSAPFRGSTHEIQSFLQCCLCQLLASVHSSAGSRVPCKQKEGETHKITYARTRHV